MIIYHHQPPTNLESEISRMAEPELNELSSVHVYANVWVCVREISEKNSRDNPDDRLFWNAACLLRWGSIW